MQILTKEQAVRIIMDAACKYDRYLNKKQFLILFRQRGGEINYIHISFKGVNFLHLTGVKTDLSAAKFYESSVNQRLSPHNIDIKSSKRIKDKLAVLPYLHELLYNNCLIGLSLDRGLHINADYFVGNRRIFISLGVRTLKNFEIPITLYNEDINKLTTPTYKVIAILSKRINETAFENFTYNSGIDLNEMPEKIKKLIHIK